MIECDPTEFRPKEKKWTQSVNENSAPGLWEWDLTTDTMYFSSIWKELLGYKPDELVENLTSFKNCLLRADRARVLEELDAFIRGKDNDFSSEYRMTGKNGDSVVIVCRASLIRDKVSGKAIRLLGSHHRIAESAKHELGQHSVQGVMNIMDNVACVSITDPEGRIIHVSENFQKVSGYSQSELIGENHRIMKSGVHSDSLYKHMWKTLKSGKIWRGEMCNRSKDGSLYWMDVTSCPVMGKEGQIIGYIAIRFDINNRKKYEQDLTDALVSEQQITNILDGTCPILKTDPEGKIIYANNTFLKISGYLEEEVIGQYFESFVDLAEKGNVFSPFDWQEKNQFPRRERLCCTQKSGKEFWVDVTFGSTDNGLGKPKEILIIMFDISEVKASEAEVKRTSLFLNSIFDNLPLCVFIKHADSLKFVHRNKTSELITGISNYESAGKTDFDIFPESIARNNIVTDKKVLKHLRPITTEEELCYKGGDKRIYRTTKVPVMDGMGKPVYLLGISEDLTDSIHAEKERQKLATRLQLAQRLESIGHLAAGIAHEVNTPAQYIGDNLRFLEDSFVHYTSVLKGYRNILRSLQLLEDQNEHHKQVQSLEEAADLEYLLEEIPQAIDQALEGVSRISEIVNAMKQFAHPGTEEKKQTDLNDCIKSTVTISKNVWKYVATVETSLDPDLPLIYCYPGDINQALLNLVTNAADAIEDAIEKDKARKGLIKISTQDLEDTVVIIVSDNGCGIPKSLQEKVFEHFFTTKEVGRGTGQGLSLVHSVIVDKHQGTIELDSNPGEGTAFTMTLPKDPNSPQTVNQNEN